MAGLDYTVVKKTLKLKQGLKQDAYANSANGYRMTFWATSKTNYEPIQNIDAFTFFDILVAEGEAIYETAGIIWQG